ncbi:carboxyl transferase [Methylobacterium sp. ME121]|nr:carboxyl transferase [Methylobacterium sp. ME121]
MSDRAVPDGEVVARVRAMIASDEDMQEDWDLAVELRISDPIVRKAVAGLALLGVVPSGR